MFVSLLFHFCFSQLSNHLTPIVYMLVEVNWLNYSKSIILLVAGLLLATLTVGLVLAQAADAQVNSNYNSQSRRGSIGLDCPCNGEDGYCSGENQCENGVDCPCTEQDGYCYGETRGGYGAGCQCGEEGGYYYGENQGGYCYGNGYGRRGGCR